MELGKIVSHCIEPYEHHLLNLVGKWGEGTQDSTVFFLVFGFFPFFLHLHYSHYTSRAGAFLMSYLYPTPFYFPNPRRSRNKYSKMQVACMQERQIYIMHTILSTF